jgi:deoxyadenosine/deoxycytidine kinase
MPAELVSIIGPPASGKTTLATIVAEQLGAELVLEDYAGNPFLNESYMGEASAKLPAQLYFLMSRVQQLSTFTMPEKGVVVSDYGFMQDRVYAEMRLGKADLEVYQALWERLEPLVRPPSVCVLLLATPQTLCRRIRARGRDHEQGFSPLFLDTMQETYIDWVHATPDTPVVVVDTDEVDFRDPQQADGIIGDLHIHLALVRD